MINWKRFWRKRQRPVSYFNLELACSDSGRENLVQCTGPDSNQEAPECKSEILRLEATCSVLEITYLNSCCPAVSDKYALGII
jgi:hypothetical protein